ncbi:Qat anti-phage system TatD family nuclease QatD [Clostridium tyrobutyricum]|uniref:Qat anti-phage system TatD family nuclease QatD n=1 Tax=Clostridium tyrobutyricum TaxID=1519 RepID=UPI002B210203|nr:Qat anti-phage system TatD family nuclease QatD [Clostridium tyrobutyricum]MEA5009154.1 Qat anti-phage system TatD family nuclease QatD [Clostridium tyrobutyricum]
MFDFKMDAHMHFDLYKDKENVLNMIEKNKSYTIAMTNLPDLYKKYSKKYLKYKYIRIALGFHPELVYEYSNQIGIFIESCKSARFIGEVGLDFTINDIKNKNMQVQIFKKIIEKCSCDGNKVMSIHSRRASSKILEIMKNYKGKAILHWYTGSISDLYSAVDRGYYFSINHHMLQSISGRKIIDRIPIEKILIESDAPFTEGLYNKYDLFFINMIYEYLAKLNKQDIQSVKKKIKSNFRMILS